MTQNDSNEKILEDLGQEYTPERFDQLNQDHIDIIQRVIPDMRPLEKCHNPVTRVWFRMGLLVMREMIAAKREGLLTPAEVEWFDESVIRSVWPTEWLGDDPGTPRKLNFNEIVQGGETGPWTEIQPAFTASIEALPEALAYLQMIGVMKHEPG